MSSRTRKWRTFSLHLASIAVIFSFATSSFVLDCWFAICETRTSAQSNRDLVVALSATLCVRFVVLPHLRTSAKLFVPSAQLGPQLLPQHQHLPTSGSRPGARCVCCLGHLDLPRDFISVHVLVQVTMIWIILFDHTLIDKNAQFYNHKRTIFHSRMHGFIAPKCLMPFGSLGFYF